MDYVVLRVEDTGAGMARDVMERIFEPFFTTKPVGKGTGLGLAVVHGIILNHRGAIAVTSRIDHGTTIDIWLPEAVRQTIQRHAVSDGAAVSNGARRILIVDDDVDFGDMLATTMERLGYEVAVATDPRDAIATIEEDAAAWDLILTDQNMPGLPGLEVIARVKRRRPELPCILCTGYGQNVTEAVALQAGASAYVRKPVDIAALERTLRDLLGPR
jgi:CheY-like chemotaxis protein